MNQNQTPPSDAPDSLEEAVQIASQAEPASSPVIDEVPVEEEAPAAPAVDVIDEFVETDFDRVDDDVPSTRNVPTANDKVVFAEEYVGEIPKSNRIPLADSLILPTVPILELNEIIDEFPRVDLEATEHGRAWLARLQESQLLLLKGNALDSCQHQEGTEWVNRIQIEGERYGIARPRFGDEKDVGLVTGERARQKLNAAIGLGATLRIPLWHSGIYVSISAPKDNDLLQLHRLVETEKVTLGRLTHALLYSNHAVVTNMHLVDFILRHVYNASVAFDNIEELKKIILVSDLQTLIWAMLCTIYPAGYPYQRPCVQNPTKCDHLSSGMLYFTKMAAQEHRKMTLDQKRHMRTRSGKATLADIRKYQAVKPTSVKNEVVVKDGVRLYLRTPTLADYQESGMSWIEDLKSSAEEAFAGRMSAEQTNQYIISSAQVTAVRNYAHYVEKIVMTNVAGEGENVIEDRETLELNLSDISGDQDVYETIINSVGTYIEESTMFFLAIPRYSCPKCGTDQGIIPAKHVPGLPDDQQPKPMVLSTQRHPYLIPIEMSALFFITTGRRITRALMNRPIQ